MPRINLLPWRQQERKRRQKEFAIFAGGAVVAALAVALLTSVAVSGMIDRQKNRNEYLKKEITELDRQITEILGLEAQRDRLIARMEIIDKLQRSRPEVVHLVDQIVRTLPDGIYLTSVKQNDKRLEIKGVAQSSTRVSTFMRNIEASDWLADPQLQVVEARKSSAGGADFVLFATAKGVAFGDDEAGDAALPKGKSKAGAKQAARAAASGG